MMDKILQILSELRPDVDFTKVDNLVEDEVIDSFDLVALVGELCDAFDVEIGVEDLVPENFNSVQSIWNLIQVIQEGR
ncbi:MAG: acyl carrier protein [Syntrophomonadaceae bacterium]|nr:acyl carrier protein [Syntrophomonadaceae bacterium]